MNKKTILYILGGVAVVGVAYFLWNKKKKAQAESEKETTDDTAKTEDVKPTTDKKLQLSEENKKKILTGIQGTLSKTIKNMPKPTTTNETKVPASSFEGNLDLDLNY